MSILSNIFGFFVVSCLLESGEGSRLVVSFLGRDLRPVHYSLPSPLLLLLSLSLFLPREDLLLSSFRTDDFFVAHAPLVPRLPADSPLCHRRHRRRLLGGGGGAISNERAHFKRAQLCAEGGAIWGPAPLATALQPEQSPRARVIYDGPQSSPLQSSLHDVQ